MKQGFQCDRNARRERVSRVGRTQDCGKTLRYPCSKRSRTQSSVEVAQGIEQYLEVKPSKLTLKALVRYGSIYIKARRRLGGPRAATILLSRANQEWNVFDFVDFKSLHKSPRRLNNGLVAYVPSGNQKCPFQTFTCGHSTKSSLKSVAMFSASCIQVNTYSEPTFDSD